jgi:ribosomal protein L7Ae-like RNA K-turn-binding protein
MEPNKIFRMLGLATRAGKISFGTESTIDLIKTKKAKLVIVATDSAERTKKNIFRICEENNVTVREYGTIYELSNCIGKVNKAIIGIKDINFSNEILKLIDGGEIIG